MRQVFLTLIMAIVATTAIAMAVMPVSSGNAQPTVNAGLPTVICQDANAKMLFDVPIGTLPTTPAQADVGTIAAMTYKEAQFNAVPLGQEAMAKVASEVMPFVNRPPGMEKAFAAASHHITQHRGAEHLIATANLQDQRVIVTQHRALEPVRT